MHSAGVAQVEVFADTDQDTGTDDIEQALETIKPESKKCEPDQGRQTAACQYPVIDLQHEKRRRQRQYVDDTADEREAEKRSLEGQNDRRSEGLRRCLLLVLKAHSRFFLYAASAGALAKMKSDASSTLTSTPFSVTETDVSVAKRITAFPLSSYHNKSSTDVAPQADTSSLSVPSSSSRISAPTRAHGPSYQGTRQFLQPGSSIVRLPRRR